MAGAGSCTSTNSRSGMGRRRQASGPNDLGAAPQAGIRHRHRPLSDFHADLSHTSCVPRSVYIHVQIRGTGTTMYIETCPHCGGTLRVIACIEEPALIARILGHVQQREELNGPLTRAPPGQQEVTFNLN